MLTMANVNDIRNLYNEKGLNISEIHRKTGFDPKTIRLKLDQEDFNVNPVVREKRKSLLSPYHAQINKWLEEDKKAKRKQRHTALRIFNRLRDETTGFNLSYRTVAAYVKIKRNQLYPSDSFLPLDHPEGEAQVDFGKAEYIENGLRINGSFLVMSFPFSNAGYCLLFPGETAECLLEGMKQIFKYIGGVPTRIWFDNASSMVIKVKEGGERVLTESFMRFKHHYGFSAAFCNPASGHEKGHVENKVGYVRRNMLVPIPEFQNLQEYNKLQLARCDDDMNREHYKKGLLISELFAQEKPAFRSLPTVEYEVCRYDSAKADSYGKITLEKGIRTYSTMPAMAGTVVKVKQTALYVFILDAQLKPVVTHKRLYGNQKESMDWLPYLSQLSRRPGALKYTPIFKMLPDSLQQHLHKATKSDCGKMLKTIAELTKQNSFELAINAVSEAIERGVSDHDSIVATHNRLHTLPVELPPIKTPDGMPKLPPNTHNGFDYDLIMRGGQQ